MPKICSRHWYIGRMNGCASISLEESFRKLFYIIIWHCYCLLDSIWTDQWAKSQPLILPINSLTNKTSQSFISLLRKYIDYNIWKVLKVHGGKCKSLICPSAFQISSQNNHIVYPPERPERLSGTLWLDLNIINCLLIIFRWFPKFCYTNNAEMNSLIYSGILHMCELILNFGTSVFS